MLELEMFYVLKELTDEILSQLMKRMTHETQKFPRAD